MLYVLRSFSKKDKTSLKVGFTNNLEKRMYNYKIQNPFFELISTRFGNELDETRLHFYLNSLNLKENFLKEWFKDDSEVIQRFHDTFQRMNKEIWRNRNNLFKTSDLDKEDTVKYKLYEELKLIFFYDIKEYDIDRYYKQQINKKLIKKWKTNMYNINY